MTATSGEVKTSGAYDALATYEFFTFLIII